MKKTVYCFTNLINNKKYIGSTIVNPNIRYNQHIYNSKHQNAHQYNYPLYQAFRKYGIENFKFEILESKECSEEEIRQLEHQYIIQLNTLSPNGYNQTLDTMHPINDVESYKKMSETKRERNKEVAEVDVNKKIIHIWRSIADCAEEENLDAKRIAACCRGEAHSTQGRVFYWLNEKGELIIPVFKGGSSFIYKGEKGTTQKQKTNRKVAQIDLITNQVLNTFDSIALASRETNCDSSAISKVCRGSRNKAGGFYWKYVNE